METIRQSEKFGDEEKATMPCEYSLRIRLSKKFNKNFELIEKNNPIFRLRGNPNETKYLRNITLGLKMNERDTNEKLDRVCYC